MTQRVEMFISWNEYSRHQWGEQAEVTESSVVIQWWSNNTEVCIGSSIYQHVYLDIKDENQGFVLFFMQISFFSICISKVFTRHKWKRLGYHKLFSWKKCFISCKGENHRRQCFLLEIWLKRNNYLLHRSFHCNSSETYTPHNVIRSRSVEVEHFVFPMQWPCAF